MEINILAFGQIAELTGKSSWKFTGVNCTDELVKKLTTQFPSLPAIKYAMAVNKKVIHFNTELNDQDTVALLPPFSGG